MSITIPTTFRCLSCEGVFKRSDAFPGIPMVFRYRECPSFMCPHCQGMFGTVRVYQKGYTLVISRGKKGWFFAWMEAPDDPRDPILFSATPDHSYDLRGFVITKPSRLLARANVLGFLFPPIFPLDN